VVAPYVAASAGFDCFGLDFIFGHHGSASVITNTFPGASAAR